MKFFYENTYWNNKGKFVSQKELLHKLIPDQGPVTKPSSDKLEKYRQACNCYYDLYNNGLCNRKAEFRKVFGFSVPPKFFTTHKEDDKELELFASKLDAAMDLIIYQACVEQEIPTE